MPKGMKINGSLFVFDICALLCVIIWGGSFVWSRVLINDIGLTPVEVYIYRFAIAYILIWPFSGGKFFAKSKLDELLLALCGICGGSIYFIAENNAVHLTTPSNVSLITTLSPLFTTLLVGLFYKNERATIWVWLGSIVSFIGVMLTIVKPGEGFDFGSDTAFIGIVLAFSAALSWSFYSLILRKVDANYSATFITRKTFFYGLITALPLYFGESHMTQLDVLLSERCILNLLYLGLGASLFSYFVWSLTVKRLGAIRASNYLYIQPIATMFISAAYFTDDPLTLLGFVGCGLIIFGIWFGDFMNRRKRFKKNNC